MTTSQRPSVRSFIVRRPGVSQLLASVLLSAGYVLTLPVAHAQVRVGGNNVNVTGGPNNGLLTSDDGISTPNLTATDLTAGTIT